MRQDGMDLELASVESLAVSGLDAEADAEAGEYSNVTSLGEAEEASESEGLPPSCSCTTYGGARV